MHAGQAPLTQLERNLAFAQEACTYANNLMQYSSSHPNRFFGSFESDHPKIMDLRLRFLDLERSLIELFRVPHYATDSHLVIIKDNKARIKDFNLNMGNCGEHAYLILTYIRKNYTKLGMLQQFERVSIEGYDHTFVILGRAFNSDINDPTTWGPNAIIIDTWDNQYYPATIEEMQNKLFKSGNFTYDPKVHKFIIAEQFFNRNTMHQNIEDATFNFRVIEQSLLYLAANYQIDVTNWIASLYLRSQLIERYYLYYNKLIASNYSVDFFAFEKYVNREVKTALLSIGNCFRSLNLYNPFMTCNVFYWVTMKKVAFDKCNVPNEQTYILQELAHRLLKSEPSMIAYIISILDRDPAFLIEVIKTTRGAGVGNLFEILAINQVFDLLFDLTQKFDDDLLKSFMSLKLFTNFVKYGQVDLINYLTRRLGPFAQLDTSIFNFAIRYNEHSVIDQFLTLNPNLNNHDSNGITPLIAAVQHHKQQLVSKLLLHHADINLADVNGFTPLIHAITNNNISMVKLLLEQRANVNQPHPESGFSPLHYAVSQSLIDIVHLLVEYGADVDSQDVNGLTPVDHCSENEIFYILSKPRMSF